MPTETIVTFSVKMRIEEQQLADYLKKAANMYCGLCPKEVRKLAYEFAVGLQKRVPEPWTQNDMAGPDWFAAFIKRRKDITIRSNILGQSNQL